MELWRMDAEHFDGNGRFVRFYAIESDIAAACEALEQFGWLCDCNRLKLDIASVSAMVLFKHPWPAVETNDILWLAGIPMAQAVADLDAIIARRKS